MHLTATLSLLALIACAPSRPAAGAASPAPAARFDCFRRPTVVCCQALIPSCIRCQELAKAEADAWARACRPPGVKPH